MNDQIIKQHRLNNNNHSHSNNDNSYSDNGNSNLKNGEESLKKTIGSQNSKLGFVKTFSLFSMIGLSSTNDVQEDQNGNNHEIEDESSTHDIHNLANTDDIILGSSFLFLEDTLSEISLQYAVCVSELGEKTLAMKYVRAAIESNNDVPSSSQLFHLLSLLTSSSGDDAKVRRMFVGIFLAKLYSTAGSIFFVSYFSFLLSADFVFWLENC